MRSEDYLNQGITFTRFEIPHMVRAALVNGMMPENSDHARFKELVKRYTNMPAGNVERLHFLMQQAAIEKGRISEFNKLLSDFGPRLRDDVWKQLNYEHLRQEGVIQTAGNDLGALVKKALECPTWVVLEIEKPLIEEGADYKKHIPRRNKVVLDSEQTIDAFASRVGMELYIHWNGQVNDDLIQRLKNAKYSLNEGIVTALTNLQGSKLKYPIFSYTNHSTGDEVRIPPINLVEMFEIFRYFREYHGAAARLTLGDAEGKYDSTKVLVVPKRHPTEDFQVNQVTLEYLAEFYRGPMFVDSVWWLNFRAQCGCEYTQDQTNFTIGRGEKKRKPIIFDPHIGAAILKIFEELKQDPRQYIPAPSKEIIQIADFARFNMYEVRKDNKRHILLEEAINIFLMHAMIANPQNALSKAGSERVTPYVLKPMYA